MSVALRGALLQTQAPIASAGAGAGDKNRKKIRAGKRDQGIANTPPCDNPDLEFHLPLGSALIKNIAFEGLHGGRPALRTYP